MDNFFDYISDGELIETDINDLLELIDFYTEIESWNMEVDNEK